MKCPKCDYVSFDYHQVCPKCRKDVAEEQKKLNLPAYEPNPPFLLHALTGAAGSEMGGGLESPRGTQQEEMVITADELPDEISELKVDDLETHLDLGREEDEIDGLSDLFGGNPSLDADDKGSPSHPKSGNGEAFSLDLEGLSGALGGPAGSGEGNEEDFLVKGGFALDEEAVQEKSLFNESEMLTMELEGTRDDSLKDLDEFDFELDLEEKEERSL
jgi:hypothetical protein